MNIFLFLKDFKNKNTGYEHASRKFTNRLKKIKLNGIIFDVLAAFEIYLYINTSFILVHLSRTF